MQSYKLLSIDESGKAAYAYPSKIKHRLINRKVDGIEKLGLFEVLI